MRLNISNIKKFIKKLRDFLNHNKIFFEVFNLICLSIMSILVGVAANRITKNQLDLTEKQIKAEFAPRFELIHSESDSRIDEWIRNYKINSFQWEDYKIKTNPFTDFSIQLLSDSKFTDTFYEYSDWQIIEKYMNGDSNVDLDDAINIKSTFEKMINSTMENIRIYENTGHQINNVKIEPFILCYVNDVDRNNNYKKYFVIRDYFEPVSVSYYNNRFILMYRSNEIFHDAMYEFECSLKKNYPNYYLDYTPIIYITYYDSLDNQICEYYEMNNNGQDLSKINISLEENYYIGPDRYIGYINKDGSVNFANTYMMGDLYDKDSPIIKNLSQMD